MFSVTQRPVDEDVLPPPPEDSLDLGNHLSGVVHHIGVVVAQRCISLDDGFVVPPMVLLDLAPLCVVPAIKLHHQPPVQQQVNITHPFKVNLGLHEDAGLAEIGSRQRLEEGVGASVHPRQNFPGFAVAPALEPLAEEVYRHVTPGDRAFDHNQGLGEGQAAQGVDQYVGEGNDRMKPGRWQQQPCVVDGRVTHCRMPLVVDMPKTWRMQAPEAVVRRGAGAGEQLPVPQHGNQVRGRRRKRVKSPVRLQDAPTHSASERGVVNPEPGKGRTAGGSAAAGECIWDIHSAMLAVPLGVRHLVAALCGELPYLIRHVRHVFGFS